MRLEVLGSGGAITTPKPFCRCGSCTQARLGGSVDSRWGPSVFIHGPDLLIDTPEEISIQLNRSQIQNISACLYSHWHPDHTSGKRVFEMNKDWLRYPPDNRTTKVILTHRVAETFGEYIGLKAHFDFLEGEGLIDLTVVGNAEVFQVGEYVIEPIRLEQEYCFGFVISGGGKRILVIMDELKSWNPSPRWCEEKFDLVYLPIGIVDFNPITTQSNIDPSHPVLENEHTLSETLEYVKGLNGKRFVLSHVEEPFGIGFEMGKRSGDYCTKVTGKDVLIAYDTYQCDI